MLTVNFVGCGKLGKTIAKLIAQHKIGLICGIVNTSKASSITASQFIGQGTPLAELSELPYADITFITTKDDKIKTVCDELVRLNVLKPKSLIVHCSGSLSSEVLSSAKSANFLTASVHPVRSFANPDATVQTFKNTFCSFEGDEDSFSAMKNIFEGIGGKIIKINKQKKKKYHAASVMANNYLVALHYQSVCNFIGSGLEEKIAHQLASDLMGDAYNNLKLLSHKQSLTGPIQRGDIETIKGHANALQDDVVASRIYGALGLGTLPLTTHNSEVKEELQQLFDKQLDSQEVQAEKPPVRASSR